MRYVEAFEQLSRENADLRALLKLAEDALECLEWYRDFCRICGWHRTLGHESHCLTGRTLAAIRGEK